MRKSLEEAKKRHQKWLEKQGLTTLQLSKRRRPVKVNTLPDYSVTPTIPTSDRISIIETKKDVRYKLEVSKGYVIDVPYNKGGYMVITPDNLKDVGKK